MSKSTVSKGQKIFLIIWLGLFITSVVFTYEMVFATPTLRDIYEQQSTVLAFNQNGLYNFTANGDASLVLFSSHYFQFAEDAGYTFTLTIFDHNMNILYSNSFSVVSTSYYQETVNAWQILCQVQKGNVYYLQVNITSGNADTIYIYSPANGFQEWTMAPGGGGGIAFFWIAMVLFFVGICDAFIVMRSSSKNRMRSIRARTQYGNQPVGFNTIDTSRPPARSTNNRYPNSNQATMKPNNIGQEFDSSSIPYSANNIAIPSSPNQYPRASFGIGTTKNTPTETNNSESAKICKTCGRKNPDFATKCLYCRNPL